MASTVSGQYFMLFNENLLLYDRAVKLRRNRERKITKKQQLVLDYVIRIHEKYGSVPAIRKIAREAFHTPIRPQTAAQYVKHLVELGCLEHVDTDLEDEEIAARKAQRERSFKLRSNHSGTRIPVLLSGITMTPSGEEIVLNIDSRVRVSTGAFALRLAQHNTIPPLPAGSLLICRSEGPATPWKVTEDDNRNIHLTRSNSKDFVGYLLAVVWNAV